MMQGDRLSSVPVPGAWIGAGALPSTRLLCLEDGPRGIQDPDAGASFQVWRGEVVRNQCIISAPNHAAQVIYTGSDITDFSFTFDTNARLCHCVTDGGVTRFFFFNTLTGQPDELTLPGVTTPKCTLDDRRVTQTTEADVMLAYLKPDGGLYYRQQRDRYTIERLLSAGPFTALEKMYKSSTLRLQFEVVRRV